MDGLRGYYGSKINQTEKKVFGISHVQFKKYKQTNELVDTQNKLMIDRGLGEAK